MVDFISFIDVSPALLSLFAAIPNPVNVQMPLGTMPMNVQIPLGTMPMNVQIPLGTMPMNAMPMNVQVPLGTVPIVKVQ